MPGAWLPWVSPAALAQEEKCVPLTLSELVTGLDESEMAFEAGDSGRGTELVDDFKSKMRCLGPTDLPTPEIMARIASLEALAGHFDQDPERSIRWARAAEWIVPGHLWPGAVSADHPLRSLVSEEGPATLAGHGKAVLDVPPNGAVVLSGRLVLDTAVPVDVPLFLQVCDGEGRVVRAEWQEGATFPEELIGRGAPPPVPTWWTREVPEGARTAVVADAGLSAPRVVVFGAGGGGSVGQALEQPGDWLVPVQQAGGVGSVGVLARVPLSGALGVFAEGRASIPGAVGISEGWGGADLALGPVHLLVGGGMLTTPVFEGGERRRVPVGQPVLGLEVPVPLGATTLDARVTGGGWPGASHLRAGADLRGGAGVGWMAGLEGGWTRTGFVQPGSRRALSVSGLWGGVRAGVQFGG